MERKWVTIIVILTVATAAGIIIPTVYFIIWSNNQRKQRFNDFILLTAIGSMPAQFELQIESDVSWSGFIILGNTWYMPSETGNAAYNGTGLTANAMISMGPGPGYLTIKLLVNGAVVAEQTTMISGMYLQVSGQSPTYIFTTLGILRLLGII